MNEMLAYLSKFNRREQTLLLAGGLVVAFYLLWVLVLHSLQHKRDTLIASTVATEQALGRVQLLARQLETIGSGASQAAANGADINGLINASLQENGLAMSSFIPGAGGEVRVRIDKAASEPLMQWLYDIEVKHHLSVKELSMSATNEPGQVSVNIRLVKP